MLEQLHYDRLEGGPHAASLQIAVPKGHWHLFENWAVGKVTAMA